MPADVENMLYVGERPWHGLGKQLGGRITPIEALKECELDWDVETAPLVTADVKQTKIQSHRATRRVQDGNILGIVKRDFVPIQNRDAFAIFNKVVDSKPCIETAGSLQGGAKVWALCKLPDVIDVKGKGDIIEKYILLSNAFDGRPLEMLFTPVRVVCSNTLSMALGRGADNSPRVAIRQRSEAKLEMKKAQEYMARAVAWYSKFGEFTDFLASRQMPTEKVKMAIERVFPANDRLEVTEKIQKRRLEVERLFVEGKGHDKVAGTAWALINAFAEFADHHMFAERKRAVSADQRANSIWFSGARGLKQKATNIVAKAVA